MSNSQNTANQEAVSTTTANFVTSLIVNSAIAGGEILAFTIIRRRVKAVYEPRSYMPPQKNRVNSLTNNLLTVFWQIYKSDASIVLQKNGVDAYVYIRFQRMMLFIMIPIWLLSWLVLFPIDAVGTSVANKEKLDRLTYGNVDPAHQSRLWAHLVLAWLFSFWIYYNIRKEMIRWVLIRQKYLINPAHSALAQANTILITGISKHYLDEERLAQLFYHLPGGVKKIWLNRDLSDMAVAHDARVKATKKLENAQVSLVKQARKEKAKREKSREKSAKKGTKLKDELANDINKEILEGKESPSALVLAELGKKVRHNDILAADRLVPRNLRPTHRINKKWGLPFTGTKVDTIDWTRREILRTTHILEKDRRQLADDIAKPGLEGERYPALNSAFIYFHQQIAAHMAAQIVLHDQPYRMTGQFLEVAPEDVIWSNLGIDPYWAQIRRLGSYAITLALVGFWSFPTSFIGALSNVSGLCATYDWMDWLCNSGPVVRGLIQGVLPPILLAVLNLLLPIILRQLARFEGIPRKTSIELSLMTRYTIFLVFNSFLIVTLASGLIQAIPEIARNPASIATTLAQQLPLASTFFLTFTMQQAAGSAGNLLQVVTIVFYFIKLIILGGTPRSVFKQKYSMPTPSWGQTFPNTTIIAIIGISYMIISPVINGFATAAFFLSYIVNKYLYTWVIDQPPHSDTGGLFFPKAITHLFVGLYIQQIALCTLFFLARNTAGKVSALPQAILMVILCCITLAFQYGIVNSYSRLKTPLPLSLAYLSYGMAKEAGHETGATGSDGEFDSRSLEEPEQPDQTGGPSDGGAETRSEKRVHRSSLPVPPSADAQDVELANMSQKTNEKAEQANNSTNEQRPKDGMTESERREWSEHMANLRREHSTGNGVRASEETYDDTSDENFQPGGTSSQQRTNGTDTLNGGRNKTDFAADAFAHPASKEPQRIIWLPEDDLGLALAEVADNRSIGIISTTKDAVLDRKGKVDISGPPPDDFAGTEE